jgi:MFS transporter, SP family, arabinose:H+ symporter
MNHVLNGVLIRTVLAAALGGSLLGFDTAVIAGAIQFE